MLFVLVNSFFFRFQIPGPLRLCGEELFAAGLPEGKCPPVAQSEYILPNIRQCGFPEAMSIPSISSNLLSKAGSSSVSSHFSVPKTRRRLLLRREMTAAASPG